MEEHVDVNRTKVTVSDRKRGGFNKILACKYGQTESSHPEMIHEPFYTRTGAVVTAHNQIMHR
jgi:hypothetical protein